MSAWKNGPKEREIPKDAVYAVPTNIDRTAINDGIFANHLKATHSKNANDPIPSHTICIKSSNVCRVEGSKAKNNLKKTPMQQMLKDMFYATCGEGHVKGTGQNKSKYFSPMLQLYYGRPIMINQNIDTEKCLANGAMGEFVGVDLMDGVTEQDLEVIVIDGYFVRCADVSQVKCLKMKMTDGVEKGEERVVSLRPSTEMLTVKFPLPVDGAVSRSTMRVNRRMSMKCFPLNIANARTVHKLQGRTIKNLVISSWSNKPSWIYVALSRVTKLDGLFLRVPLSPAANFGTPQEVTAFLDRFRQKGAPPQVPSNPRDL